MALWPLPTAMCSWIEAHWWIDRTSLPNKLLCCNLIFVSIRGDWIWPANSIVWNSNRKFNSEPNLPYGFVWTHSDFFPLPKALFSLTNWRYSSVTSKSTALSVHAAQYDKLSVNYHYSPVISKAIYRTKQDLKFILFRGYSSSTWLFGALLSLELYSNVFLNYKPNFKDPSYLWTEHRRENHWLFGKTHLSGGPKGKFMMRKVVNFRRLTKVSTLRLGMHITCMQRRTTRD
jgi:hypothetical protein